MTPTEEIVARAWAAELDLPQVGLDEDFIDLGSHSLQGLAIVARLEPVFGIAIPVRTLFEEPTVADLAAWIDQRRGFAQNGLADIVRLQESPGSALRPIFALPGGQGDAPQLYGLAKLARQIDPARPFFAFPGDPPAPETARPEEWIAAAADSLNARVRETQAAGPYLLLGVCAGGVLAWEMARQLERAGEVVHLLLIDTRNPQFRIGEGTFRHAVTGTLTAEERRARHRRRREWRKDRARGDADRVMTERGEEGSRRVIMIRAYHPTPLNGRVTLLVNQDWRRVSATLGWDDLAGELDVIAIGRGHRLDWHVPEVAARVRAWLEDADPGGERPPRPEPALPSPRTPRDAQATIIDALDRWATQTPLAPALRGPHGEVFTYRDLAAEIERLAQTLRDLGIGRQDRVLIVLPDGPALAVTLLAGIAAGIAAPLPWDMTRHEYLGAMAGGGARAVILPAGRDTPAREASAAAGLPVMELAATSSGERMTFQLRGAAIGSAAPLCRPQPDDVALVIHSSGTTGRPKRIPRTHSNIAATSTDIVRVMRATAEDHCLCLAPMAFSQGLNALLNALWSGGSLLALPGFDLATLPERIDAFRPTWFSATPAVLRAIARDAAASAAVRKWPPRMIRASAGAVSAADIAFLEERFQAPVLHSYGMSEASFIASEPFAATQRKPGSAGLVNHEMMILSEDGQPLPVGETGEIVVRGPNVFPGYLDDFGANAEAFLPGGWFRTGDAGWIDEDGFLSVSGRLKETIKRGGLAISPREIEDVLLTDAAIAEACVFAVPHPDLGEDVAAAVVVGPGALATERALRERVATSLSPAKAPRTIVFVTEIPRTATGKPLRRDLAAAVSALLAPVSVESERLGRSEEDDSLTARVAHIWAGILGSGPVSGDDDLFDLGADSLQVARMLVEMQQAFAMEMPPSVLFEERTPARVAMWIASQNQPPPAQAKQDLNEVRGEGVKPAIFLVSSATGGGRNPLRAARLGGAVDPERAVHDLIVPARLAGATPDHPDEMARTATVCIETARGAQPRGPYLVAGVGHGGAIACEMARQWQQMGETAHLLLIDARPHGQSPAEPFGGPVTLIASHDSLAGDATLGWGDVFGERLCIVPIEDHKRPRRQQLAIASAMRTWLQEIERS